MSDNDNHNIQSSDGRKRNLAERVRSLKLGEGGGRTPRGSRLPWVLCAILLLTTLVFAVISFRGPQKPDEPPPADSGKVAGSGDVVLESKGYIIPAHQIQVSPRVGGIVERLRFEEGQKVEKGAVLARLRTDEYEPDYDDARAGREVAEKQYDELTRSLTLEITRAEAKVSQTQADLDYWKLEYNRQRDLVTSQASSRASAQEAQSKLKQLEQLLVQLNIEVKLLKDGPRQDQIASAAAQMKQAKAREEKAQLRLDWCTIKAPVTGTILTKKAEKGNIVNPVAFNVAASICEMADLTDLEVDLSIQERDISNVVVGQKCRIMPEAFQSVPEFLKKHPKGYEGEVSRLMPIADRAKGAIPVRVKVSVPREEDEKQGTYLKPDMSVIVSFLKAAPVKSEAK
jgi:multidrug resistance efflux pump